MTAGIQIFNDSGTVQFDQDYTNLALKTKGTFTIGSPGYTTVQVANCKTPLVAVILAGSFAVFQWFSADGTTLNFSVSGTVGAAVTYYVFDQPGAPANYGLVVYRADGSVAFDATKQYARIVGVLAGTSFTDNAGTYSYPAGRTYALIVGKPGRYTEVVTNTVGTFPNLKYNRDTTEKGSRFTLNGTQVTISSISETTTDYDVGPGVFYINDSSSWSVIVADVTGF